MAFYLLYLVSHDENVALFQRTDHSIRRYLVNPHMEDHKLLNLRVGDLILAKFCYLFVRKPEVQLSQRYLKALINFGEIDAKTTLWFF